MFARSMFFSLLRTIRVVGLAVGDRVSAEDVPSTMLDEVVVTGEQPGPPLWKLTKGDHVLWILGTVSPKPKDITWRAKQLTAVLDNVQEIVNQRQQGTPWLADIVLHTDMTGPFKEFRAERRANEIRKAHAPPPLRDVLPAETYPRFATQKAKYLPRNKNVELLLPRVAASYLYETAVGRAGMSFEPTIRNTIHRLARSRNIKVTEVTLTIQVDQDEMDDITAEFQKSPAALELDCMEATLTVLESRLSAPISRANAWAIGDVEALGQLPTLNRDTCALARWNAPRWRDLPKRLETLWIETIEAAVARNKGTLVLLDMKELLESDGALATLVARGFAVEGR